MKTITIVGGGLAGLSLGIALRNRAVPVKLFEAGDYPRHKVCGEFISGASDDALRDLGIEDLLNDARPLSEMAWFYFGRCVRKDLLPHPARGISRYILDHRLVRRFAELGGDLRTRSKVRHRNVNSGTVWACGRNVASRSHWIGLKIHCTGYSLESELELHLGRYAYAGASPVEDGQVNVCGIFRIRRGCATSRERLLVAYLGASGLNALAERVLSSQIDATSVCGIAAMDFRSVNRHRERLNLGDHHTVIPPFTGNGMSMAFEAAHLAAPVIVRYAVGNLDWRTAVAKIQRRMHKKFRRRLLFARAMHPFLYHPALQPALASASRCGALPFRALYRQLR
jgi:flavin-dependent dehydrogenase